MVALSFERVTDIMNYKQILNDIHGTVHFHSLRPQTISYLHLHLIGTVVLLLNTLDLVPKPI